ncbi:MAG: flagellar biosynthetic protein FliR [Candidatus Wallbacteria bacterium]|nr:flagellar biosynthetic protein FliR [Candidatus Wallbacteria bacterium]
MENAVFNQLFLFLLINVRMGTFIQLLPVFGGQTIPIRYKAGMTAIFSLVVLPFVALRAIPGNIVGFVLLLCSEILLGMMLGILCAVIFEVFHAAGSYLGLELGFSLVDVIDPYNANGFTGMDSFLYLFSVLIFFAINGHLMLVDAIIQSFRTIPIGGLSISPDFGRILIENFAWMFYFSFLIVLPIVASILIVHIALGVVAKTAPRVQVFLISFPLKIGVGLGLLILIFPGVAILISKVYLRLYQELNTALRLLS